MLSTLLTFLWTVLSIGWPLESCCWVPLLLSTLESGFVSIAYHLPLVLLKLKINLLAYLCIGSTSHAFCKIPMTSMTSHVIVLFHDPFCPSQDVARGPTLKHPFKGNSQSTGSCVGKHAQCSASTALSNKA